MTGSWAYLALAITAEIIATSALKASRGMTNPTASIVVVIGYAAAFYCLSLALRSIPLGVAYAIWSGVGIIALAIIGFVVYRQPLAPVQALGIVLIVAGVVLVQAGTIVTGPKA